MRPATRGASGSSLEEAQSWGKLATDAEQVTVHADVTVALPVLISALVGGARETLAASTLPNGEAYYGFLVRKFTTLALTHAQVHQTGLEQVAAIRK